MRTKIHKHLSKKCDNMLTTYLNGQLKMIYEDIKDIKDNIDLVNNAEIIEYKKNPSEERFLKTNVIDKKTLS